MSGMFGMSEMHSVYNYLVKTVELTVNTDNTISGEIYQ